MLGDKLTVVIKEKLADGIYEGTILDGNKKNRQAYILSKKERNLCEFCGETVAIGITQPNLTNVPIMVPVGEVYYKPEIESILSSVPIAKFNRISCLYEKSCGAVVYCYMFHEIRILLVKNHNGRYWSFPKGHMEEGEDEVQTALRELKEETGLDVRIFEGFREISDYCPYGNIKKRVVFFLAESKDNHVIIQQKEIDNFVWATFDDAKKLCCFENDQRVIQKAKEFLGY
ncbi:MAG: NUDIX domain-containing protein [Bacillota bacterium]|nr:NUDIX domain-containing protein [Bacillota bacterium]